MAVIGDTHANQSPQLREKVDDEWVTTRTLKTNACGRTRSVRSATVIVYGNTGTGQRGNSQKATATESQPKAHDNTTLTAAEHQQHSKAKRSPESGEEF